MKRISIYLTAFAVYYLFVEIVLRIFYFGLSTHFFTSYNFFLTKHYPELIPVLSENISKKNGTKNILILGGSVVSTNWSNLETKLEALLRPHLPPGTDIRIFNAAAPANTSLDNLIKYKQLDNYNFDLVIYYEAINENRFNNIPASLFEEDYSHVEWYRDVNLILQHSELDFTVIPYTFHFVYKKLKELYTKPASLDMNSVPQNYIIYGNEIKTALSYRKHIQELIHIANSRNQPLLLMSYASFFPEGSQLIGSKTDETYFGDCNYHSSISIWGDAENVKRGIAEHNKQLRELVALNKVLFLDMDLAMPRNKKYFCDVCHLDQASGVLQFATIIKDYIVSNQLLWNNNSHTYTPIYAEKVEATPLMHLQHPTSAKGTTNAASAKP